MATAPRKGSSRSAQLRAAVAAMAVSLFLTVWAAGAAAAPRRLLVDTDMDTDDLLALLYILKQNRSEFDLKVGAMSPSLYPRATCHRRSASISALIRW
jgi:hypothetical protein